MNMKQWIRITGLTVALLTVAGTASAHVTVWPKQSTTGAYEKYTVRVPVEKDSNTVKVQLFFPQDVKVETVEPAPGWSYTFQKDANGQNTGITWTATAGGIKPHEFTEFSFIGVNPKTPEQVSWKALQTYADGSVVEWTGAPDSKTPASVTSIVQTAAANNQTNDMHNMNMNNNSQAGTQPDTHASSTMNTLSIILSGIAVLLSLVSLFRKKSN
jgi:uncharacterized protein YcnI